MKKGIILTVIAACLLAGCGKHHKDLDPLAETGRTQNTETLLANMKAQADSAGYMFGHQDDMMYGIGWKGDSMRSDIKSVCGDYPAVFGFDLGYLESGSDTVNLDGVSFDKIKEQAAMMFQRGAMITLSWHPRNPLIDGETAWVKPDSLTDRQKQTVAAILPGGEAHDKYMEWLDRLAEFISGIKTPYGVKVPVVFRPYHENTGSWFWWGENLCSAEQYKQLWQMTIGRFKEKGVTNVLYAYSPGGEIDGSEEKFLERYPGDDLIDIVGFDQYCFAEKGDTTAVYNYQQLLQKNAAAICAFAKKHGKAAAITETGFEGIKTDDWWTHTLQPVLDANQLAYVLVWRNAHDKQGHFYAPYPGQQSCSDFIKFYNNPKTLFLKHVNALYVKEMISN